MQSLRQILELHSNFIFQLEQLNSFDVESFFLLLKLFLGMMSPYVYYSATVKDCSLTIERYVLVFSLNLSYLRTREFCNFVNAYVRFSSRHNSLFKNSIEDSLFSALLLPMKQVSFCVTLVCRFGFTICS